MRPILITGGTGLLGANLAVALSRTADVVTLSRERRLRAPWRHVLADLTSEPAVAAIQRLAPRAVVHCAAATDVDACERDPEMARRQNVLATANVAAATRSCGARLVHISTDAVFDGRTGGYTESDVPAPVNVYGRTKLEAERAALAADVGALVIRTNFYGWSPDGRRGLAEWILRRLASGETVPGFTDVFFGPLLVTSLCRAIAYLIGRDASGVLHVAGRDRLSKWDFARALARAFGYDEAQVIPATVGSAGLSAPRPRDISLDPSAAISLGVDIPDLATDLAGFAGSRASGDATALRALIAA